jgi:hypothetical protein
MPFVATTLRISAGVIVWILHFAFVYGVTALACARGLPAVVPWVIGGATAVAGTACLALIAREWRRPGFEAWLTIGLDATALLAILWETLPVFMVPICR